MIRLLVISDIHLWALPSECDKYYPMRKKMLDDIKDFCMTNGPINHILISGDIANTGSEQEYDKAYNFIQELCMSCNCKEYEVYVIPGNHDKNFSAPRSGLRHLLHGGLSNENINSNDGFLDIVSNDNSTFKVLYEPFKAYNRFATKLDSIEPLMAKGVDPCNTEKYDPRVNKMYFSKELSFLGDYKINLFGMNSALISDWNDINDNGKGHKLFLSPLAYNIDVNTEGNVNILMVHHPLENIREGKKIQDELDKKFQIQIYGHLHKPASDNNNVIHIHSGAFQPPIDGNDVDYFSVYNIIELDIEEKNGQDYLKLNLQVEKYNNESFEHMKSESKTYTLKLKKHINRWENEKEEENMEQTDLPSGVSIREVRHAFLQSQIAKKIMKDYKMYDERKSISVNSVEFLKTLEMQGKLKELWDRLK